MVQSEKMIRQKEDQLQFLRFFAFMNVFAMHSGGTWGLIPFDLAWNGAISAVSFFFMLSGMLVGYKAYGKNTEVSIKTICSDMRRKIWKVYPLHLLTTGITVLNYGPAAAFVNDFRNSSGKLIQLAKNLLLIQAWFPENPFSYNVVSWYLSTLLFLYLLNLPAAAVLHRIEKKKHSKLIIWCLIAVLSLTTVAYNYAAYSFEDVHFWQYVFPLGRIGQYLLSILAGYLLCGLKIKCRELNRYKMWFTAAEIFALVLWIASLHQSTETWYSRQIAWICPNLFLLAVFLIGQGWLSDLFRLKPLVFLGDISFECYITHQIIICLLVDANPVTPLASLLCIALTLGYTLLLAYFIHKRKRSFPRLL